ncbi:unnamed protein product [Paramecium primaurelia]|uniref:MORN repeat protein n=1 Tax=Paramecium primaurelia TaxID=5886 RepID=A0A8S1QMY3_PARPR|nr:unnamed protein product [Paramecium primaurelia]
MDKFQEYTTTDIQQNLTNLEQLSHLEWSGIYGQNNQKIGIWKTIWKGQTLNNVGGWYSNVGKKMGLWKLLIHNYWSQAQAFQSRQYSNDKKIGEWKYIYDKKKIGGGLYNQLRFKNGKQIELSDGFSSQSQVILEGEYKNGKKIGKWDIFCRNDKRKPFKQIGGGSYDIDGMKIGRWVDFSDEFYMETQVTYNGEYKNGKKIGKWDIKYLQPHLNEIQQIFSGGGSYDEGCKNGNWIEMDDKFNYFRQSTHNGEYKNGKKVGRWDNYQNYCGKNKKQCCGMKIGQWIVVDDENQQITHIGEYKNSKKIGRWEILFQDKSTQETKQIGGGLYDEEGEEEKIGYWTEQCGDFQNGMFSQQITNNGEQKMVKKLVFG